MCSASCSYPLWTAFISFFFSHCKLMLLLLGSSAGRCIAFHHLSRTKRTGAELRMEEVITSASSSCTLMEESECKKRQRRGDRWVRFTLCLPFHLKRASDESVHSFIHLHISFFIYGNNILYGIVCIL